MADENFRRKSGNSFPKNDQTQTNWRATNADTASGSSSFNERRRNNSRSNFGNRPISHNLESSTTNNTRSGQFNSRPLRSMGYMFLDDLLKNDAEKIILQLIKEREGFLNLLQKEVSNDILVLIIKILTKLSSSAFSGLKYNILLSSFNEKFVNKLRTFIACLPTQDAFQKRTSNLFWKDPNEFWTNLIIICEDLLITTPTFACRSLPVLLSSFKVYIPIIEQEHNIQVAEDIKRRAEKLNEVIQASRKENEEKEKLQKSEESLEPPDDFRQISVYPSPEEIVGGRGFLRENIVKGPYQNVNHYLDVQFRLLREDFVGPLRDGIANYRSPTPSDHLENVKVHKSVYFLQTETINEFYCLRVQFTSKKKALNFENSRRFMFGSLLCFTKDNFKTLFFGKVGQRKVEDLNKGQVIVAFDEKLTVDYTSSYLMVECGVYFEPYFHVLNVLKDMNEGNFPMERYFIRVNPSIQPPEYLTLPDCTYTIEGHSFNPLLEWPNENFYNLNDSQIVAFKAAVTQEISVIQGPPGTGKTYLGLKIAETLLRNTDSWYDHTPILVICYTNHALDQFLEGLIPVTKKIVRVGGQSKNENLDVYNLRRKTERDEAVAAKRREVQNCLHEIKRITENLQQIEYYNSVLSFGHFAEIVPDFEGSWFERAKRHDIVQWLLEGATFGQERFTRQNNLDNLQVQDEFNRIGINDDFVEVDEEENGTFLNDHIISTLDSIFGEVLSRSFITRSTFLITLSWVRDQSKKLEDDILQLRQIVDPTLQQMIKEEELCMLFDDLRQKYEYLKWQLTEGRKDKNIEVRPTYVDLKNPHSMVPEDRWRLYFYWLGLYKKHESDVLRFTSEDFPSVYKEYEDMTKIQDVRAMKEALVVGMTTTSAARLRSSLQTLKNPIVIVEEAAEVLEAHIVTSITKHCDHLILIGDHKQLKPNTANYSMGKQYRLGISLFERMIRNDIHCYTLNVQHRMRPEISSLIRPSIYDFLEDHPSVLQRPPIMGVDNCLFFIDHDHPEEECEGSSKVNQHEVTFLIYLARHLVLNGYNPENITILAAYLGQFFAFQREKKAHLDLLKGMKVAVLDNYQGEESDIILLSLVRNNKENKIGFLAIENRVCVALSRARNGMYIMGNMTQLSCDNKLWGKIKATLEKQKALGKELPLRCQIHQDQVTLVKCETDFFSVSEGGCSKKCDVELKCGHKCTYLCHIRDRGHMNYRCQSQCDKKLCNKDETHICTKMCYQECGPCCYLVQRTLSCGHEVKIPCHIDPKTYKCQILVSTELPCGHQTDKPCYYDPVTYMCPHICDIQVQPCGHACEMLCHARRDPDHLDYQCKKPCSKFMRDCSVEEEDHRCKKLCYEKCDSCTISVRKLRTECPHLYDVPCNSDVDELICEKPCAKILNCRHSCKAKCNEPCQPCQMKVVKLNPICNHPIKVKCCESPDRKFCTKLCPLMLPCGHPCVNRCNEPCTTSCKAIVECSGLTSQCGHVVTRMECYMTTSNVDSKLLLKFCTQLCQEKLKCGHLCPGSCGACAQGRVHLRCSEKCGALLVCNHQCDFPCRQACQPCKRKCDYRCAHTKCPKTCGEVCTPCKEKCTRRCRHQWCRRFCGDVCDVSPCTEPCPEFLGCGHPCIGFCGDPCPKQCLVCNKDEVLDVFFGTETEDARYVFLNDCKHLIENSSMEMWLEQKGKEISYKLCPRCKTAIRTTQRYSDYIKRAIKDVAQVKSKTNGKPEEIAERRKEIAYNVRKMQASSRALSMYCSNLRDFLGKIEFRVKPNKRGRPKNMNIYEAQSIKAQLQIIENILDICSNENVVISTPKEIFFPQVNFILQVLFRDLTYITNQEIEDISLETTRLARLVDFSCLQKSPQFDSYSKHNEVVKKLIATINDRLSDCKRFTEENNEFLKAQLMELNEAMKTGLAISDPEKKEILQAMGFSKGHWYKCPNGHIYAIGDCGGAMVESRCNECGAKIGGRSHRLLDTNAVATEMDGAVHGAWTERANLLNYDMAHLQDQ